MAKIPGPGTELDGGKYRILRLIGQGGMGSVFEAEHRDTRKRVAIKCLHPVHAADPEVAERLVREAQATARVRHPNIVDVYDVGRDEGLVYLVMEYLEGETLTHALQRDDLSVHARIALLLPAIRGVEAAHRQGVIHRDLKPDNIFLARRGDTGSAFAKVLDFGISKLEVRGTAQRSLTRSGVTVGTPSYMSYEQLSGEPDIDGRTDVYAFGVILYEALTGKVPYEADTFTELVIRFANSTPTAPKILRPGIPTTLSRVVMWALEKDRAQRIATMGALAIELEPFSTSAGLEAEQTQAHAAPELRHPPQDRAMAARLGRSDASPSATGRELAAQAEPEMLVKTRRLRQRRIAAAFVVGCLLLIGALGSLWLNAPSSPEPSAAPHTAKPAAGVLQPLAIDETASQAEPTAAPTEPLLRPAPLPLGGERPAPAPTISNASPVQASRPMSKEPAPTSSSKRPVRATPPRDLGIY